MSLKWLSLVLVMAGLALSIPSARAQAKSNDFDGTDEVIAQCVVSTKQKYAQKICSRLSNAAEKLAEKNGVDLTYLGVNSVFELTENTGAKPPLQLIFYVRGTRGKNVGASVRIVAGVYYAAAVESLTKKSSTPGPTISRQGLLVLWEKSSVGQGPSTRMSRAISAHMIKKMGELFEMIDARE